MSVLKGVSHCDLADWKLLYISRIWASIQEEIFPLLGASEGLSNIAAVSLSLSLWIHLDWTQQQMLSFFFLQSFKWLAASCPPVSLNEALFLGSDIIAFGFPLSRWEPCSSFQSHCALSKCRLATSPFVPFCINAVGFRSLTGSKLHLTLLSCPVELHIAFYSLKLS